MQELQLDGTKICYHINELAKWHQGEQVYPLLVEVSPTNQCNHNCTFCAYEYLSRRPVNFINADRLLEVTNELSELGTKALFYSGEGEPLLHKELPALVEANAKLDFDQALNTNGVLFKKGKIERILPLLSWLRVSVNGGTPESYRKIHSAGKDDFSKVIKNLKTAVAFKKRKSLTVTIGVQLVYVGQEMDEIVSLAKLMKKIGVDYFTVKSFNQHPAITKKNIERDDAEKWREIEDLSDENFLALARNNLQESSVVRSYEQCLALPFFAEIVASGDVYTCGPFLGYQDYCYGSIYADDFSSIWSTENRERVEKRIVQNGELDQTCMPNCRLNAVNSFLWGLKNPPTHVNFI